ncbi:hypothetical protein Nepgr_027046 [Nepenthes gracilis]|uniref:Uncharacterized protein n=1 Tax=Nepenthes gracilis TaxID=150966 RepID=A0AAD3T8A7_NEPGR|nr:hypothetical protein Nepgr_027046 [Nepenthes gracilis]
MEKKLFKPYDKQFMRTAMLKHEEIFRQQLYELHRLYRIQKILMNSIEINRPKGQKHERWIVSDKDDQDHDQQKAEESMAKSNGHEIDESKIELTLGPATYNRRRKTENPSCSRQSPSSSSTGSSQITRKTTNLWNFQRAELGFVKISETEVGFQNGEENTVLGEEDLRQDGLKQPPWLF